MGILASMGSTPKTFDRARILHLESMARCHRILLYERREAPPERKERT
jgi:hypothetical protein